MLGSENIRATKTDLVLSEQKRGRQRWLVMCMRTDSVLYLELIFALNLLILFGLRPNTLSCTQSYYDIEVSEESSSRLIHACD